MSNQNHQTVYIIAAKRTAVTKAKRGGFAKKRSDELLALLLKDVVNVSKINPNDIADVVIGCAFPEAEQGLNIARISVLLAGLPDTVPGLTINRYCSSGLNAIAIAANMISMKQAHVVIAGGVENMSQIPMGGNNFSISPDVFVKDHNIGIAYGMGITAEIVANKWGITREMQDEFALKSNQKAINAINNNYFYDEILPVEVSHEMPSEIDMQINHIKTTINCDDGARADTSLEALAKLKPAFANNGSVTAGNSSQMSDGASCLVLVSEEYLKQHNLTPIAKFINFNISGVAPDVMGIGPIKAIPAVLKQSGLKLDQIDWIELNEAFAAQSLAVINELHLDQKIINPYGGAIALGHPLGATGAILSTKLIHGLKRTNKKYGIVSMCIGTGMGAAGIIEAIN